MSYKKWLIERTNELKNDQRSENGGLEWTNKIQIPELILVMGFWRCHTDLRSVLVCWQQFMHPILVFDPRTDIILRG